MSDAAYIADRRARHRAAGLCLECGKPPMPRDPLCLKCRERQLNASRRYREKNRAQANASARRWYHANKARANETRAARYQRLKEQGLCVWCGAPSPDALFCATHDKRVKETQREWWAKRREKARAA